MKTFNKALMLVAASIILISCQNDEPSINVKKLDYYIDSYETSNAGFEQQAKVLYQYDNDNRLRRYTVFAIDPASTAIEEQHHFEFTYSGNTVNEMKGYLFGASTPYVEYAYQYLSDSRVSKINENNYSAAVTSEATFSYNDADKTIKIVFTYTNGGGFEYELHHQDENIVSDKTTKGTQICNEGIYTYDQKINPFKSLGYVDYTLTTLSANNKLTEDINYMNCAFPSLIPQSYSYEYDEAGYPTEAITTFTSSTIRKQRLFFYK